MGGLDANTSLAMTPGLAFSMTSLREAILDVRNSSLPMRSSWETAKMAYSLQSFTGYSADALDFAGPTIG